MVRVLECATSKVLLVIPDDSHVWARRAEERAAAKDAAPRQAAAKTDGAKATAQRLPGLAS